MEQKKKKKKKKIIMITEMREYQEEQTEDQTFKIRTTIVKLHQQQDHMRQKEI